MSNLVTDVTILNGRGSGGAAQFMGTAKWVPNPIKGVIVEHSPHVVMTTVTAKDGKTYNVTSVGYGTQKADGPVLNFPSGNDFLEFRFPHHKKKQFFDQFLGATGGAQRLVRKYTKSKVITVQGASGLYWSYGKMNTHQVKLISGAEARSLVKDGLDAGMQLGQSIGGVILAAGTAGLSAAALSGITLGAGAVVVAVVIAGTSANNHIKNLKNKQVYFRISKSSNSTTPKEYFPYEDKIYATGMFQGNSLKYSDIASRVR